MHHILMPPIKSLIISTDCFMSLSHSLSEVLEGLMCYLFNLLLPHKVLNWSPKTSREMNYRLCALRKISYHHTTLNPSLTDKLPYLQPAYVGRFFFPSLPFPESIALQESWLYKQFSVSTHTSSRHHLLSQCGH